MPYIPKELTENVNVSKTHPLVDLAWLLGGLTLIVALIYLLLGFAAEFAATRIPVEAEAWLGGRALARFEQSANPALQKRLDALLQALPVDSPLHHYHFAVHLVETETVNALALPGGHILIFSGLLAEVKSENELLMVLGHELGHYAHRDHLKGLGRGLGVAVASLMIFGQESGINGLLNDLSMNFETHYSREQEAQADAFGVDLLVNSVGHAGGATDFFERLAAGNNSRFLYLLASHPHPQARIEAIRKRIVERRYRVEPTQAVAADLLVVGEEKSGQ